MEYKPSFVDQLDADYICHHGIKGMHWGIRRYQNTDGSLTNAGKNRYGGKLGNMILDSIVKNEMRAAENRRNTIREQKELRKETDAEFKKLVDNGAKIDREWIDIAENYESPKLEKEYRKLQDAYWDSPTNANWEKVSKSAYAFGYDYGRKTGKDLVKRYGNEAVNYFLDQHLLEGSYYPLQYDIKKLKSQDAIERFANMTGDYEVENI